VLTCRCCKKEPERCSEQAGPAASGTAGERGAAGASNWKPTRTRAQALAELEAALLAEEGCNDVTHRVIEHAVDLELRQDNPSISGKPVGAASDRMLLVLVLSLGMILYRIRPFD
jgi:hypothetical protein